MKRIALLAVLGLGLGFTTAAQAQTTKALNEHIVMVDTKVQSHVRPTKAGVAYAVDRGPRRAMVMQNLTAEEIATNKTAALDKRVGGLTNRQEKKVYKVYLKEAKQQVKLRDLKRENKAEIGDVLTKKQKAYVHQMHAQRGTVHKKADRRKMMHKKTVCESKKGASCCDKKH